MEQENNQYNNEQNQNINPNPISENNMETPMASPKQSSGSGPAIAIIIIVLVIIIGGLYFWGQRISKEQAVDELTAEEILNKTDDSTEALNTQGVSDEIGDIEADLNATDLGDLDLELDDIEKELE